MEWVFSLLSGGTTTGELPADYPDWRRDDIFAALAFGAKLARVQRIEPLTALRVGWATPSCLGAWQAIRWGWLTSL